MKPIHWLILLMLSLLSTLVIVPAAHAAPTTCSDGFTATTIPGDLLVPAGVYCELDTVTVRGDVRVDQRSTLAVYNSRIAGSLTGARFELVILEGTRVGQRIRLTGGVSTWLERTTVAATTRLIDIYDTRVLQSHALGDVVVRGAREQVQFCGTTVAGDARFAGNTGGLLAGSELATCAGNRVQGTLRVHHNQADITIANNAVGQNLVCAANEPAPTVSANQVGGTARGQCGAGEAVDPRELEDPE